MNFTNCNTAYTMEDLKPNVEYFECCKKCSKNIFGGRQCCLCISENGITCDKDEYGKIDFSYILNNYAHNWFTTSTSTSATTYATAYSVEQTF